MRTISSGGWRGVRASVMALCCACGMAPGAPSPAPFTYQGELADGGTPANGTYDLQFRMFIGSGPAADQAGGTLCSDNVTVTNGRFTVVLDFAIPFGVDPRFLEIAVRPGAGGDCSSGAGFTTLGPRQQLMPTPFAHHAATANRAESATTAATAALAGNTSLLSGQAGSFYTDASNLSAGTIPSARLTGVFSSPLNLTNTSNTYFGSGANLLALNAANVSAGTLTDARLSSNVALRNAANTFSQPMTINSTLNVNSITIDPTVRSLTLGAFDFEPGQSVTSAADPFVFSGFSAKAVYAGVHLPQGATVTEVRAFVKDASSVDDTVIQLLRRPVDGSAGGTMATVTTAGNDSTLVRQFSDVSISGAVIDNETNTYFVRLDLPASVVGTTQFVRAVRIHYTVTQPLP